MDMENHYFSHSFDLDSTEFLADPTTKNSFPTGWKLYSVPLDGQHVTRNFGDPRWNDIKHVPLGITASKSVTLQIAGIEFG